jgi:hypothetical protein
VADAGRGKDAAAEENAVTKSGIDPNYDSKRGGRPSGNEGRLHPDLKLSLYWQEDDYKVARARARKLVQRVRIGLAGKL